MTAFEPEAIGNLVEGLEFHKFYFDNRKYQIFLQTRSISFIAVSIIYKFLCLTRESNTDSFVWQVLRYHFALVLFTKQMFKIK